MGEAPLVVISPTATRRVVACLPEELAVLAVAGAPIRVHGLAPGVNGPREYVGAVASLSASVDEAPLRSWSMPNHPMWGAAGSPNWTGWN